VTSTTYSVGVQNRNGTVQYESATHALNTTVLVVLKFISSTSIDLWVNPSTATFGGGADPVSPINATISSSSEGWETFALISGTNTAAGACNVDNFLAGPAYADVTPSSSAPAAPASPTFSGAVTGGFTAGWSAASGATGYRLDVATDSGFTSLLASYRDLDVGNVTSAALTGLAAGTTYYFRVRAYNGTGISASSAPGSGSPLATLPSTPATGVGFPAVGGGGLTVSWTAGDGANSLVLVRAGSAVNASPVSGTTYTANSNFGLGSQIGSGNYVTYLGSGTSVSLTGLSAGVTYYVAVYTLNGSGGTENYLTTSPATGSQATAACTPPSVPAAPTATAGCSSVTVSWNPVSGAASYNIYRSTSGGAYTKISTGQTGSSYGDSPLAAGTTYNYELTAVGSDGCESATSAASGAAVPSGLPAAAPVISSVTPACGSLTINWGSVSDATSYNIYRKASGGVYGPALATGQTGTSYQDSTAVAGTSYVYAVTAVNACGENPSKSADSAAALLNATAITVQPASTTGPDGSTTNTFTLTATGAGLGYQWQTNSDEGFVSVGTANGGQTATYTLPTLTTALNGLAVQCVVSNSTCSQVVTSAVAVLTVGTHYRSHATGTWHTGGTWDYSADGVAWLATTNIPTLADTTEIQNGHTVTVNSISADKCASVTVDTGGTLRIGSGTIPINQRKLFIAGSLTNNGSITGDTSTTAAGGHQLDFTASGTWSGSGNISAALVGVTVDAGATLTLATANGLSLYAGNTATSAVPAITINGTLNAGTNVLTLNSGSFTLNAGATLVTAGAGGITNATPALGTLNGNAVTLNSAANFAFNGTVAQVTTGLPATMSTLTISNNAGVTLSSAVAVSGLLQINRGTLNPNDNTSSAWQLSFDSGATNAVAGTWGSTSSGAANPDNSHFAGSHYVTVLYQGAGFGAINPAKIVLIKCDDFRGPNQAWTNLLQVTRALGVKIGIGIICTNNIDPLWAAAQPATYQNTTNWLQTQEAMGDVEFWDHAWDHTQWTDASGNNVSEYQGSGLAYMQQHLAQSQAAISNALSGRNAIAFGTAFNGFDTNTATVVNATPVLRLFFGYNIAYEETLLNPATAVLNIIPESDGTSLPNAATFEAAYPGGPAGPVALQFHPAGFDAAHLQQFQNIIQYLQLNGYTMMMPSEYLAFISPAITALTTNLTVSAGQSALLSVAATGNAPLSYQWYDGPAAVAGATNAILTFAHAAGANAGNYTVVVSNVYGSVTSSVAALTVACAGTLGAGAAASTTITYGCSYSLNGSATGGSGGYAYSWTSVPAGFTSTLANPAASPATNTTYSLTVTDTNGCTASASVTVAVSVPAMPVLSFSHARGLPLKIPVSALLTNASDAMGDTFTLASVASTSQSGSTLAYDRDYIYYTNSTAPVDQPDRFTYTLNDPCGTTPAGTVIITINTNVFGQNTTNPISLTPTNVTLSFVGYPGYNYTIQKSTDLVTWTDLLTTNAPASGLFQYVDGPLLQTGSVFYRLRYNAPAPPAPSASWFPGLDSRQGHFAARPDIMGDADFPHLVFGTDPEILALPASPPLPAEVGAGPSRDQLVSGAEVAMAF
jgi:fibronectin type 3 domain-containing protein